MKRVTTFTLLFFIWIFIKAQDHSIWGTNGYGGAQENGTIYKLDSVGNNLQLVFDFPESNGIRSPKYSKLTEFNGQNFGYSYQSGLGGYGHIFKYNPSTNIITKVHAFNGSDGYAPSSGMCLVGDSIFYGCTVYGGSGSGVFFSYDPALNIFTKITDVTWANAVFGSPVLASNGKIYMLASGGGAYNKGAILEFNLFQSISRKFSFDSISGYHPMGEIIEGANGHLYGMTQKGGTYGKGTLFEFDLSGNIYTVRHNFIDSTGGYPEGTLWRDTLGNFFGMSTSGGLYNGGTIFKYVDSTQQFIKLFDLDPSANGGNPKNKFTQGPNGNLYALTSSGGNSNYGTLFEFNVGTNQVIVRAHLDSVITGGNPDGVLTFDSSNATFYGICPKAGVNAVGTLFTFNPQSNQFSKQLDFDYGISGIQPQGYLVEGLDGKIYGVTGSGGLYGVGLLYRIDPGTGQFEKLYHFKDSTGRNPRAIMQAPSGIIYGVASGGIQFNGVLFSFDPGSLTYNTIYYFNPSSGSVPNDAPILATNGKLYGTASEDGTNGNGTIYEYDIITNTLRTVFSFDAFVSGSVPRGRLTEIGSKLYGICGIGGVNAGTASEGTIFSYNLITDSVEVLYSFNDPVNGYYPNYSFGRLGNKLWGTTSGRGQNNRGTIFEFDVTSNTITKKYDFIPTLGYETSLTFLAMNNNNLLSAINFYNSTRTGGIFEFDPINSNFTLKQPFDTLVEGHFPFYGGLIQLKNLNTNISSISETEGLLVYPNPTDKSINLKVTSAYLYGKYYIYDALGKIVDTGLIYNTENLINTKEFPNGFYSLLLQKGSMSIMRQFLINRK